MKPVAVVLATFLLTGSVFAGQKDKIIGKQVRLPNHGLGTIVGRSEEGFIIMAVDANGVRAHSAANRLMRRWGAPGRDIKAEARRNAAENGNDR